jgi:D-xylose transport system permease protein
MTEHDTSQKDTGTGLLTAKTESVGEYARKWWTRVKSGDLGALPIIIGLIVIALIFRIQEETFFSSFNFVNLLRQMAGLTALAIGVVFVLLIAEIDLSVGYVSGVGGVTMTLLLREGPGFPGWHWSLAILAGLAATATIGLLHGLIITKARVPSFVVTLAGFLAWSGVVLILATEFTTSGTIVIQDRVVLGVANNFLTTTWSWILFVLLVAAFGGIEASKVRSLRNKGLPHKPIIIIVAQIGSITVISGLAVYFANRDRGVPMVTVLLLILLVVWSFVASRTRFGRHVYAVGGNPEAARRAGINVDRVRIMVFVISSFMAGVGGVILASRLRSVDTATGGGNLLLNAIAAAVIGGTSLFGGQGKVVSALLGALVIASVDNGMGLLGLPSGVKFVITGSVLLAAVLVDAFARRGREASGIA